MALNSPEERLRHIATRTGLDMTADRRLLESYSNDAWQVGDKIVRVCWRGDISRLLREASVACALPREVPYPPVIDYGTDHEVSWMITTRLEGEVLSHAWPKLDRAERRSAIRELAKALAALHMWSPPAHLLAVITERATQATADDVVGADINPLPVERALRLAPFAKTVPFVDAALIDAAAQRMRELEPYDVTHADQGHVIHSDAHFANLLWSRGEIVALLDFEWVRLGPIEWELEPFFRNAASPPEISQGQPAESEPVYAWFRADYPELFTGPLLVERLWLADLACALRDVLVWPPYGVEEQLAPHHPLRRLHLAVEGPNHLVRLLEQAEAGA